MSPVQGAQELADRDQSKHLHKKGGVHVKLLLGNSMCQQAQCV